MYSRISWHKHVSCAFSRLPFSLLKGRVAGSPHGRTHARHPSPTLYLLLPSPYFGNPLQSVHALLSPFFSLLTTLEAHCKVSTHYLLLSSPFSLLSCPLVVLLLSLSCISCFSWFPPSLLLLNGRAAEPPCRRAQARHPRTTFSFLLPSPYFGSPLQSDHALPSPFFSLLPTFVSISGSNCFVFFVFFVV